MASARQPPSQDDILEAALATLTEDDIPPDEVGLGWPDPECAPPAELADLTGPGLEELLAAEPTPVAEIGPTGFLPRDGSGGGCGFADGGELDVLGPGAPLAGFADDAHARLAALTDDELIGVLRAWRRQTSWAQARELAAMAELARRRPADATPGRTAHSLGQTGDFTADEIAVALTLTRRAAGTQLDLALALADRPATAAALEAGRIDLPRTRIIIDVVAVLTGDHAAAVEAASRPGELICAGRGAPRLPDRSARLPGVAYQKDFWVAAAAAATIIVLASQVAATQSLGAVWGFRRALRRSRRLSSWAALDSLDLA